MKATSQNKTGNGSKAQAALAQINAQIEALNKQRIELAQPLKDRYSEMRGELMALENEVRELDPSWKPEPMKAKAETKILELLASKGEPLTAEEIVEAMGNSFTPWKVKNTLKKKSTGPKAVFTLKDGRYGLKPEA